jgi:3-hydroxyacyl-CoA dehydrogenase/enoyl-CoA hydratase/3-hydroxybutyryl-CoA epimerase
MHFFNPVEKMPLVEIVRGAQTSESAISLTCSLTTKLGKYPIVVEDVPGFLVNRILTPYLVEAARLMSEGYMIEDIDRAATRFGMPMGPIRLLDEVGLDVAAHVSEILAQAYGERMQGPEYAKILVGQKRLGKKNGIGFYRFEGKNSYVTNDIRSVLNIKVPVKHGTIGDLTKRLILPLINEAVRCFDEGVAGTPCKEAAQQIDLGSVMGFGFPPFRGGLLHYANSRGAAAIATELIDFAKMHGERFVPCSGISARAKSGASFYTAL